MLSSKPRPAPVVSRSAALADPIRKPAPAAPRPIAAPATLQLDLAAQNPFRKVVLYFGLAALFVKFSLLSDIIAYVSGANTYLLYATALPAIAGAVLSGGIRRTFQGRAPYFWMLFFGWMVLATPFSFWKGGSTQLLSNYVRANLPFLFIAGSLALNLKEVRAIFYTIAAAAVVNLFSAQIFMDTTNGRISLEGLSSIGNSNDLAAHLLLVLPFVLFIVVDRKRSLIIRIPLLLGILYGVRIILGTASRGALIALVAGFIFLLWRATPAQRVVALAAGVILAALSLVVLPSLTLTRLGSLFGEQHEEAEESEASRLYLFQQSVLFTFQHPVFGVDPGSFQTSKGTPASWRASAATGTRRIATSPRSRPNAASPR